MPKHELDYEAIRQRAEKRVKDRVGFYTHLAIFIAVNAFLWGLGIITDSLEFPWPLIVTASWGIGLAAHAVSVYLASGAMERMQDEAFRREIEREKQRLGIVDDDQDMVLQKPKRKSAERP